jgi:hypothetical protein
VVGGRTDDSYKFTFQLKSNVSLNAVHEEAVFELALEVYVPAFAVVKNSTFDKKIPVFANTAVFDAEYVPGAKRVPYCTFDLHVGFVEFPKIKLTESCVDDEFDAMYEPPCIPICPYTSVPTHAFVLMVNAHHAFCVFDDASAINVEPDDMKLPYHSSEDHPGPGAVILHASAPDVDVRVYTPGAVKFPNTDPSVFHDV